jgi:hypothetical protein
MASYYDLHVAVAAARPVRGPWRSEILHLDISDGFHRTRNGVI